MARGVEPQVVDDQDGGSLRRAAPRECSDSREELREGERLREVVVGARVQPQDPILHRVACRQHQDGSRRAGLSNATQGLETVDVGEHDVEDQDVVGELGRHPRALQPARRDIHGVALLREPAPKQAGHLHGIFDDEHAHGNPLRS